MVIKPFLTFIITSLLLASVSSGSSSSGSSSASNNWNFEEEQNVLIIRHGNIEKAIKNFSHLLVIFYTPWCIHCKTFLPEFAKAAATLRLQGSKVALGKVDCALEKELGAKYGVTSYPSVKLFLNGRVSNYTGGRVEQEIVNWVTKTTKEPCKYIEDNSQLSKYTYVNDAVVIFWGDKDSPDYETYEALSREVAELPFLYTTSQDLQKKLRGPETTKLTLLRKFEEPVLPYIGDYSTKAIKKWIREKRFPMIMDFQDKYAKRIFGDKNPLMILVLSSEKADNDAAVSAFIPAAFQLRDKIYFATTRKDSEWGQRMVEFLGPFLKVPFLAILRPLDNYTEKYIYKGNITLEGIKTFHDNFINRRLYPSFKTAPTPKNQTGLAKVLVGKTFKSVVYDNTRDVFIMLFAPWCKHSQATDPVWESLAEYVSSIQGLVISKMDVTANEVEGLNLFTVPQMLFYPSNNKTNPITFEGQRTLEGFWNWLKTRLTVKYDPSLLKEIPKETPKSAKGEKKIPEPPKDMSLPFGPPGVPSIPRPVTIDLPPGSVPMTSQMVVDQSSDVIPNPHIPAHSISSPTGAPSMDDL